MEQLFARSPEAWRDIHCALPDTYFPLDLITICVVRSSSGTLTSPLGMSFVMLTLGNLSSTKEIKLKLMGEAYRTWIYYFPSHTKHRGKVMILRDPCLFGIPNPEKGEPLGFAIFSKDHLLCVGKPTNLGLCPAPLGCKKFARAILRGFCVSLN